MTGVYDVSFDTDQGCSFSASIEVLGAPPFEIDQDIENVSCAGESDGSITLLIGGGTPGYDIIWDNGVEGEINNNLSAGLYEAIVTDENNCSFTYSITLVEPDTLQVDLLQSTPDTCLLYTSPSPRDS